MHPDLNPTPPPPDRRGRRIAVGLAVVAVLAAAVPAIAYLGEELGLVVLAFLGAAAGVGTIMSAEAKGQTIGGALTTGFLLAFAAFALVAPAVIR